MFAVRAKLLSLAALALLALPLAARAGGTPCEQTQAAIDLRSCSHCRDLKRLLSEPGLHGVSFEVTPLRLGATVRISADNDDARLFVQELVDRVWGEGATALDEHACDFCLNRQEKLSRILVDWTATGDGAQLVLISEDPELAQWALQDARSTQGWVLSSATN